MSLFIPPTVRATDANGNTLSGAKWYFYRSGTTTLATTYTTSALTVANANPVVADAGGLFPDIYLDPALIYRAVLKTALGATISDVDPYSPAAASFSTVESRTELAAITSPTAGQITLFDGYDWEFDDSDLSAEVTADTEQGVFVAPATDTTGASGAWRRKYDGPIRGAWFGLDGTLTTAEATDALNALGAVHALLDGGVIIPNGTHTIYSDATNGSGVLFSMPPSNTLRISGEGPGTIIKRAAVSAGNMNDSSRVVQLEATQDGNYILENFTVDGNEANVPYDASTTLTLYQYEHAHNIIFVTGNEGAGVTLGDITTRNLVMKNAVADGFSHNWPYRNAFHENPVETGRSRRVRSGWQLGVWTGVTHIKGGYMSFLENEPVSSLSADNKLIVEGVVATENFDLSGYSTTGLLNLTMIGCKALLSNPTHPAQRFNLGFCKGEVIDCDFKGADMVYGASQLNKNQLTFRDCSFTIPVNPSDATMAIPIIEWKDDTTKSYHKFYGCRFFAPSGITSVAAYAPPSGTVGSTGATGVYIMPVTNNTTSDPVTSFVDCVSDENLPNFYYAKNAGTVTVSGGAPRAKTSLFRYASTTGFVSNLYIDRPERFAKSGLGKMMTLSGSTGTGTISVSGTFDGELMGPLFDGTSPGGVTYNVSAIMLVDSSPVSRLRGLDGLRARLRAVAAATASEWVYRNSGTPGSTTAWEVAPLFNGYGTTNIGYATGAGGTVTQGTSRTTGVTLNKLSGAITLFSAAGSATWQTFTVTNSQVAATDTVEVCQKSGTDLYQIQVTNVAAGSFKISFATTGGTTTEQPVFNFNVIKGATA